VYRVPAGQEVQAKVPEPVQVAQVWEQARQELPVEEG